MQSDSPTPTSHFTVTTPDTRSSEQVRADMRAAADRFLALGTQDAARGVFAAADALRDAETREMYEREEQRAEWCQAPTASDAEGRAR